MKIVEILKCHFVILTFLKISLFFPLFLLTNCSSGLINLWDKSGRDIIQVKLLYAENPGLTLNVTGIIGTSNVDLTVPSGTDISSLIIDIKVSKGASVFPPDGSEVDFSMGPVIFTVTAEDSNHKDYLVTVNFSSDTTPPNITPVSIASNNADPTLAVVDNTISLTFTSDEDITTPTVTILENTAVISGGPTSWTATYTAQSGDREGVVAFSISGIQDLMGNTAGDVTSVTDASSVTFVDTVPSLSIDDVSTGESAGTAQFTVSLSAASSKTITVDYASADATAAAGSDYTAISLTTLTFNPGETTKTIDVSILTDSTDEYDETYNINLSNESNATISDGTGLGTITDDDNAPEISFSSATSSTVDESATLKTIDVVLSAASEKTITVDVTDTETGSAVSGTDYNLSNSSPETLTFNPGETTKSVSFTPIVDTIDEDTGETIIFSLSNESNATLAAPTGHTATITDDDGTPIVNFSSATGNGDENISPVDIAVEVSNATILDVVIDYTVSAGTAAGGGTDFNLANGQVTIGAGTTSANISFTVNSDLIDEDNEDFQVTLTNVSSGNAILGTTLAYTYTINDDDGPPSLSIDDVSVGESDGTAQFTVTLSAVSEKTVTVDYETADIDAAAGSDYSAIALTTLTFNPGEISKTIDVSILTDTDEENDETYNVNLSNESNAVISDSAGLGTIIDDDSASTLTWPKRLRGTDADKDDSGNAITTDASGNIFITGYVSGDVDLNNDAAYLYSGEDPASPAIYGGKDIIITKYDAEGAILWAKRLGGAGDDEGLGITTDIDGDVILTGYVTGNADLTGDGLFLDPGEDSSGYGGPDIFISKFTSDGTTCLWSKRLGAGSNDSGYSISTGPIDKSVVVAGLTNGDSDLSGNGDTLDGIPASENGGEIIVGGVHGGDDIFVSKFDSTGTYLWSIRLGGLNNEFAPYVGVDSGQNVVVTGTVDGAVDLDADGDAKTKDLEDIFGNLALQDVFVSKFDQNGVWLWGKKFGEAGDDRAGGIAIDSVNNIIITGYVTGNADLTGDADTADGGGELAAGGVNGGTDVFISKFDSSGTSVWTQRLGGVNNDRGTSITIDSSNDIILTGIVDGNADLNGNDLLDTDNVEDNNYGLTDIFISKFDSSGAHNWSKRLGGTGDDSGLGLAIGNLNNVYATGSIFQNADLNGDGNTDDEAEVISNFDDNDIFISIIDPSGNGAGSMKNVLTFNLLAGDNASLPSDVTGIVYESSVQLGVPVGTDITDLVPEITTNGLSVSPDAGAGQDFTNPVLYTVTAQDLTTKVYTVVVTEVGKVNAYTIGGINFNMISVPGLKFKIGIDDNGYVDVNTRVPSPESVTNAYEIGETEVTYQLWSEVYTWATSNGYIFINPGVKGNDGDAGKSDQHPVTHITWREAMIWCNALTEYYNAQNGTSFEVVYTSDSGYSNPMKISSSDVVPEFPAPGTVDNPYVNPDAKGFRLPYNMEFSCAARYKGSDSSNGAYEWPISSGHWWTPGNYVSGGTEPWDAASPTYTDYAVILDNSANSTAEVGTKIKNFLGLYDMSGNVNEYNFDYHPLSFTKQTRMVRGPGYLSGDELLQLGYWYEELTHNFFTSVGFRLAKSP